jgi:flagellar basal body rod protein FlgG
LTQVIRSLFAQTTISSRQKIPTIASYPTIFFYAFHFSHHFPRFSCRNAAVHPSNRKIQMERCVHPPARERHSMDSGYYAACAGLAAQTQALELLAHNLANLSTTGYRAEETTFRSLMTGRGAVAGNAINAAVNDFGVLSGSRVDLTSGSFAPTGNPLDAAVAGKGFFTVQSGQQIRYTRNGSFHVTAAGQLVTSQGDSVIGEEGPITLPNGNTAISGDGTISVDGNVVDKLHLAEFAPETTLTPIGNATYTAPPSSALVAADSTVEQGMLEGSNVSPTEAVVQLITVQRNAEMMARAVSALDGQLNQIAVQDLPKV